MIRLLAIVFVLFATVVVGGPEPCIALQVRPRIMLTRGDIRIEIRIPRHAHHRVVALAWTSDVGSEGSSQRELEGEASPALVTQWLKAQPPGNYFFTAAIYGPRGQLLTRAAAEIVTPERP